MGEDIPFQSKFLFNISRGFSIYLFQEYEKDSQKIIFLAFHIASENFLSDSALLLSGKITSKAITAAQESFNLSIIGI